MSNYHLNDPRPQPNSEGPLNIYSQPDGSFWIQDRLGYLCTTPSLILVCKLLSAKGKYGARELLFPGSTAKIEEEYARIVEKMRAPVLAIKSTSTGADVLKLLGLG